MNIFKSRANVFKAMSHPCRLQMIDALSNGELCVSDIQKIVGFDLSTVSKHLTILKVAGLVEDRKEGLRVYYSLRVPCITNFIGCVEKVVEGTFQPIDAGCGCVTAAVRELQTAGI